MDLKDFSQEERRIWFNGIGGIRTFCWNLSRLNTLNPDLAGELLFNAYSRLGCTEVTPLRPDPSTGRPGSRQPNFEAILRLQQSLDPLN